MVEALFQQRLNAGDFDNIRGIQLAALRGIGPDQLTNDQFQRVNARQRQQMPPPALAPVQPVHHPAAAPPLVNEQQQRWNEVLAAGIDCSEEDNKTFTRRYWLNYFWGEARARASTPGKLTGRVEAVEASDKPRAYKDDFVKKAPQYKAAALNAQAELIRIHEDLFPKSGGVRQLKPLDNIREEEFRDKLCTLLHIGFRGVPINARPLGRDGRPSNIISYCRDGKDHLDVRVGWRSESRSWEQIVRDKGTKRQVDVDKLAGKMHMREPWHPFSIEKYKNCLWFRAGNQMDNCLYSVISVGNDFKTVTSFPLIIENPWRFPSEGGTIKPLEQWTVAEKQQHRNNIAVVRLSDGQPREMVVSTVYVYLFLLRGLVLDTSEVQEFYGADGFPERGVTSIKLDDIFGYCRVLRVHHGFKKTDGHTGFIRQYEYAFPNTKERTHKYGDALPQLEQEFRGNLTSPFVTAWAEGGRTDVVTAIRDDHGFGRKVQEIVEFPSRGNF
jgi:hypothetical protein